MKLIDLLEYYDPEDDHLMQQKLSDTRNTKLTLRHLNKMKKMKMVNDAENETKKELVKNMYGSGGGEDGGSEDLGF